MNRAFAGYRGLTAGAACLLAMALSASGQSNGRLHLEIGTDMTFGKFTYSDATVDISEELINPRVSVEFALPDSAVSLGLLYAASENRFSLDFDDGKKQLDGDLDVERTDLIAFLRFGPRDRSNLRLGYRRFEYEFSNGELDETRNRVPTKRIRDGSAEGDLTTGVDAEVNLVFGENVRFGIMLGVTYFKDAKYRWEYRDELAGGRIERGTATLDALSLRLGPELVFPVSESLRLFVNYSVSATSWLGSKDDEHEEYAGVDIMTGFGIGIRYAFGGN